MVQEETDQEEGERHGSDDVEEHEYDEEEKREFGADSYDKLTSTVTGDRSHCRESTAMTLISPILIGTRTWRTYERVIMYL